MTLAAGHWVGILTGLALLEIFRLRASLFAVTHGGWPETDRRGALVGITSTLVRLIRYPRRPGGASTLIVSLGSRPPTSRC
jgi:hypothetical protein